MNESLRRPDRRVQQAMLRSLVAEMGRLHAQRRARRRMVSAALLLTFVSVLSISLIPTAAPHQHVALGPDTSDDMKLPDEPAAEIEPNSPSPTGRVELVHTDPAILHRHAAAQELRLVRYLDDDGLIDTLHEMNRPTGLVRIGRRVFLTASVTDEPRPARF